MISSSFIFINMPLCRHHQRLHCFKKLLCAMCIVHTTRYQSGTIMNQCYDFTHLLFHSIFPLLLIFLVSIILQYNSQQIIMQFSSACISALLAPILVTAKLSDEFDERHLAASDCDCTTGNPDIEVSGSAFRALIASCINDDDSCPGPIKCWNTSKVTDMSLAFYKQDKFNDPLECWETSQVTNMYLMFVQASSFLSLIHI